MNQVSYRNTREMIMASLKDVKPKTIREISKDTGLSRSQIGHSLMFARARDTKRRCPVFAATPEKQTTFSVKRCRTAESFN